jgi:myo-inositol-1(or 4)-monophosphatase
VTHGYDADLRLAIAAARRAGAATLQYFGAPLAVEMKSPDQPLTAADLHADELLREDLAGARPAYGWLSEESADGPDRLGRQSVWIVDPIDGTRSFIAGRPEYTISIGLAEAGAVVVGVVYNPARDELFHAVRGRGAWLETAGAAPVRLQVSGARTDADIAGTGRGRGAGRSVATAGAEAGDDVAAGRDTSSSGRDAGAGRRLLFASRSEMAGGEFEALSPEWTIAPQGSTAYKLALVGAGRGDAFLSRGPKSEWDVCAGALIVTEAGGRVTDITGAEPVFNRPDPYVHGVIGATATLHGVLLALVGTLPPTMRVTERERERERERVEREREDGDGRR